MNGEVTNRMQCAEFEAMLAEALDGNLGESEEARFQAHLAACSSCAPLFNQAQAGLNWLSELRDEEVEPPTRMVENILRATVGTSPIPKAARENKPWRERLQTAPLFGPVLHTVFQPRFAMSFGMAFFSITLLLNLAGVRLKNIGRVDLRPSAIVTAYYATTGRIVKYWENIRFVYEIESRIRDLKKATASDQADTPQNGQQQQEDQKKRPNRETSKVRNQDGSKTNEILAKAAADPVEAKGPRLQGSGQRRSL